MKLVSFEFHGEQRLGALENLGVVDLGRAHKLFQAESVGMLGNKHEHFPQRMIDFLEIGEDIRRYALSLMDRVHVLLPKRYDDLQEQEVLLDIANLRILPPVPVPRKIVCLGVNYGDHPEEAHVPIPERPIIFSKPSTAVVGTEDPVVYPKSRPKSTMK